MKFIKSWRYFPEVKIRTNSGAPSQEGKEGGARSGVQDCALQEVLDRWPLRAGAALCLHPPGKLALDLDIL